MGSISLFGIRIRTTNVSSVMGMLLWAACIVFLGTPTEASATRRSTNDVTNVTTRHQNTTLQRQHVYVRHIRNPAEEGRRERDQRLRRECRGRPNAGACLGYTK